MVQEAGTASTPLAHFWTVGYRFTVLFEAVVEVLIRGPEMGQRCTGRACTILLRGIVHVLYYMRKCGHNENIF